MFRSALLEDDTQKKNPLHTGRAVRLFLVVLVWCSRKHRLFSMPYCIFLVHFFFYNTCSADSLFFSRISLLLFIITFYFSHILFFPYLSWPQFSLRLVFFIFMTYSRDSFFLPFSSFPSLLYCCLSLDRLAFFSLTFLLFSLVFLFTLSRLVHWSLYCMVHNKAWLIENE